ncbi:MAG: aminoacyl-tRNA hydrolase [Candidatus Omnitrophica bacterium]|nr:aminoacyl-tRNA hydrolase [Candidatus Omnitrophota bacterium]
MKLIVGLGNPGLRYKNTKHNAGFWVIDKLASHLDVSLSKNTFDSQWNQCIYKGESIILAKPATFMNLSGRTVRNFINYFKIPLADVLIVFDEVALPLGVIRLRSCGTAGGHKGLASILDFLQDNHIARLRFGIDLPSRTEDLSDYVLSCFKNKEAIELAKDIVEVSKEAVLCWIADGISVAMNRYNRQRRESSDHE